jgi:hypothetical protein
VNLSAPPGKKDLPHADNQNLCTPTIVSIHIAAPLCAEAMAFSAIIWFISDRPLRVLHKPSCATRALLLATTSGASMDSSLNCLATTCAFDAFVFLDLLRISLSLFNELAKSRLRATIEVPSISIAPQSNRAT